MVARIQKLSWGKIKCLAPFFILGDLMKKMIIKRLAALLLSCSIVVGSVAASSQKAYAMGAAGAIAEQVRLSDQKRRSLTYSVSWVSRLQVLRSMKTGTL